MLQTAAGCCQMLMLAVARRLVLPAAATLLLLALLKCHAAPAGDAGATLPLLLRVGIQSVCLHAAGKPTDKEYPNCSP